MGKKNKKANQNNQNTRKYIDPSKIGFVSPATTTPQIVMKIPTIFITPEAYHKMALYVAYTKGEVGWLGYCTKTVYGDIIVHDVYLPKQEANSGTCELTPEGLTNLATEILDEYGDNGDEIVNNLKLWGHSHGDGGVYPSGRDSDQLEEFRNNTGYDWFVTLIANQKGLMRWVYSDFENGIEIRDIPWKIKYPVDDGLEDNVLNEIDEKISLLVESQKKNISPTAAQKGGQNGIITSTDGQTSLIKYSEEEIDKRFNSITILNHPAFDGLTKEDLIKLSELRYMDGMEYIQEKELFPSKSQPRYLMWKWCVDNKEILGSALTIGELHLFAQNIENRCKLEEEKQTKQKQQDDKGELKVVKNYNSSQYGYNK